jgi:hypothetical protein
MFSCLNYTSSNVQQIMVDLRCLIMTRRERGEREGEGEEREEEGEERE